MLHVFSSVYFTGNDNDPEFETASNPTQVTLMENEPVGTKVARISARDRDQGENG